MKREWVFTAVAGVGPDGPDGSAGPLRAVASASAAPAAARTSVASILSVAALASLAAALGAFGPPVPASAAEPGPSAAATAGEPAGQPPRVLPDPTRPSAAGLADPAAAAPAADGSSLRLQSVLLGNNTGRVPAALISGALVPLGGRVGDAQLTRLTEHSAVLQGPQGRTTLMLISGVEKIAIRPGDAAVRSAAKGSASADARVAEVRP